MSAEEEIALPPLHLADIDLAKVRELFTDVDALGEGLEIVLKHGAEAHVGGAACTSLADAERLLASGAVLGLQLRYQYRGGDWWDTIMRTPDGFRLVRIQHPLGRIDAKEEGV